jgi:F-type H+-transporting ATPase subunit delta
MKSRVAGRYAKSIMDLAIERNELETVYADMLFLKQAFGKSSELVTVLKSPIVPGDKKIAVLVALGKGKISEMTLAFNNLLVKKGREAQLPEMADAFIDAYKKHKQIHIVKLTSATELSEDAKNAIVAKVKREGNLEHIELVTKVDPALIGGFILEVGDSMVDTSVASRLNDVKKQFQNNDYIYKVR